MQGKANDVAHEEDKNLKRQGEVGEGETTAMTRLQNGSGKSGIQVETRRWKAETREGPKY